jgi:hypothetical protein
MSLPKRYQSRSSRSVPRPERSGPIPVLASRHGDSSVTSLISPSFCSSLQRGRDVIHLTANVCAWVLLPDLFRPLGHRIGSRMTLPMRTTRPRSSLVVNLALDSGETAEDARIPRATLTGALA